MNKTLTTAMDLFATGWPILAILAGGGLAFGVIWTLCRRKPFRISDHYNIRNRDEPTVVVQLGRRARGLVRRHQIAYRNSRLYASRTGTEG